MQILELRNSRPQLQFTAQTALQGFFYEDVAPEGSVCQVPRTSPPLSLSITILYFLPWHTWLRFHSCLMIMDNLARLKGSRGFFFFFFCPARRKYQLPCFFSGQVLHICTFTLSQFMCTWTGPAQVLKNHFGTGINNIKFHIKGIFLSQL